LTLAVARSTSARSMADTRIPLENDASRRKKAFLQGVALDCFGGCAASQ